MVVPGRRPIVFFLTNETDERAEVGTLYGGLLESEPEVISERAGLPLSQWVSKDLTRMLIDLTSQGGTLVDWSPSKPLRVVKRGVVDFDGSMALTEFDGATGTLVELPSSHVLGHAVPPRGFLTTEAGLAMLTDFDADTRLGTLRAAPPETIDFENIATQVPLSSIGLLGGIDAVVYLRAYDRETDDGTLGIRVLDTADTFDLGIRADDWYPFDWPRLLLVYTVPHGPDRGIWAAEIR